MTQLTASPARGREVLAASPLGAAGGVVVTRLLEPSELAALAAEARVRTTVASPTRVTVPPGDGEQRGQPDRWLDSAVGGDALARFFIGSALRTMLAALTGLEWAPLGNQGIYSYYRRPGHYLGLHRDAPNCTLAVITCVADDGLAHAAAGDSGGELVVYPGRAAERVAAVRREPDAGATPLRLQPGESAVLLGSLVPHRVTPVGPGRTRIVAPLCYRPADA